VLHRLRWLIWKDLLDSLRSQTALIVLLSPLLLALLMQTMTRRNDVKAIPVAVVGPAESGFFRVLEGHPSLRVERCLRLDQARQLLESRQAVLCVEVGADFDERLTQGRRPDLKIWSDRSRPTQTLLAREYLRGCLRQQLGTDSIPVHFQVAEAGVGRPQDFWFASAVVLASMSAMVLSAANLVEEKEAGTLQQMLLSPASPTELWVGKLAVSSALGTVAAMSVVALRGPSLAAFWGAFGLTAVASFVFAALGGVIGLLAKGPAAASSWTGICFIAFFAPASLSETSQALSRWAQASPAFYLYDGLQRTVLGQESATSQVVNFTVLITLGALLTWVGARLLRRYR
jgi:ABC-2 type transport system permease protein